MQCRSCGTEIADKAIICYRCGQGTTDPVRRAVPIAPRRGLLPSLLPGLVLLIVALTLYSIADTSVYREQIITGAGICGGAGVVLLIARLLRRR